MQKQCLVTKVGSSPILYANMSRSKVQRAGIATSCSSSVEIGPGAYDYPVRSDVRTSLVLNQNPLSRCAPKRCCAGHQGIDSDHLKVRCLHISLCLAACCQEHRGWQLTRWIRRRTWEALGSKRGTPSTGAEGKQFARPIQGCNSSCKADVVLNPAGPKTDHTEQACTPALEAALASSRESWPDAQLYIACDRCHVYERSMHHFSV